MHSRQIVEQYEAPEAAIKHKAVLITVNRTVTERESVYAAVRYAWKLDPVRAQRAELVLALKQGMIVGVYLAERWMPATVANFPDTLEDRPGRWGFVGHEAPLEIRDQYIRHRLPDSLRRRGAANPVRLPLRHLKRWPAAQAFMRLQEPLQTIPATLIRR
jgi:uncharacterized protein